MEPTYYRKKPITIQAVRWDGTVADATKIIDWVLAGEGTAAYDDEFDPVIKIRTLEGTMILPRDWWVIKGVEGEFYGCAPTVFDATYDAVGHEPVARTFA